MCYGLGSYQWHFESNSPFLLFAISSIFSQQEYAFELKQTKCKYKITVSFLKLTKFHLWREEIKILKCNKKIFHYKNSRPKERSTTKDIYIYNYQNVTTETCVGI